MPALKKNERILLDCLQKDGRISNQALAEQAHMSTTPCWRMVKKLQDSGVIRRYAALLSPEKIGLNIVAYASIQLQKYNESDVQGFEKAVKSVPEIVECYSVMGEADYLLKIMVPAIQDYDRLLHDFLFKIPGLVQIRSNLALREVKYDTSLPLLSSDVSNIF